MKKFDLERRLIEFSVSIIQIVDAIPNSKAGNHLGGQLVRSGTSVSLNYGEAQSAESRKDFIHKMKVILKELRETYICIELIRKANLFEQKEDLVAARKENNELISIFVKSIETAHRNMQTSSGSKT